MKLLITIGLLLLSCGVVEAAEKHKPGETWLKSDGCNTCEKDQYGTSSCTALYCFDTSLSCDGKMKEVMREVDEILRLNYESLNSRKPGEARISLNLSPGLYRWWSNVMKECVQ